MRGLHTCVLSAWHGMVCIGVGWEWLWLRPAIVRGHIYIEAVNAIANAASE